MRHGSERRGDPVELQASGPVVVLTFAHSGVASLESVLSGHADLACTSGTGIIPLCAQAAATWRRVEHGSETMSALAASSARALAATMITCILARSAGSRWCETVTSPANSADAFAELFPLAQFVCFYRACSPVISAATQVSRWGLTSAGAGDFTSTYPGNNVAAAAAYWCAYTSALLEFESAHLKRILRIRHEDLAANPAVTTGLIAKFLGLSGRHANLPSPPAASTDAKSASSEMSTAEADQIPLELMPGPMRDRVNGLHSRLGYSSLGQTVEDS
jgi:protein-tyrosine sulfotransferase